MQVEDHLCGGLEVLPARPSFTLTQVPTLQSMGSGIRKNAGEGTYWDLDFHSLAHSDRPDIAIYSGHVALCAADRQHFR